MDVQGTIRANDTKASAALVVHGLLFAGVLSITPEVKDVYAAADGEQQAAMKILLAASLIAFLASIVLLSIAVSPYRPKKLHGRIKRGYKSVFFPRLDELGNVNELLEYKTKLATIDDPAKIESEYAAELVKLADVHEHEATYARWGFHTLRLELVLVAAYLALVGIVAMSQA